MATTTTETAPLSTLVRTAPVFRISGKEAFPYNPSTLETKFFSIPLEIRQQIYSYVFYTPDTAFQKTIKGWRDCPEIDDLSHTVNGTPLVAVSRRIRAEALPVMYRQTKFKLNGFHAVRAFLNNAAMAECAHLHVRRVSLVNWRNVLVGWNPQRWVDVEAGQISVANLADLPSLRELELQDRFLPTDKAAYQSEEWFALMSTLQSNRGRLRIVAASTQSGWWRDWQLVGGRNFGWNERILLKTHLDVSTWSELVELDIGNFNFQDVFDAVMFENWTRGPLKSVVVEVGGLKFSVRIWGVPECIRNSMARKAAWKETKEANEQKAKELARKGKGLPRSPRIDSGWADDDEVSDTVGDVDIRNRKMVTREEARAKRMTAKSTGR